MLNNSPANAQSTVAALVNDEPISTFDVRQRAKLLKLSDRRASNSILNRKALDQLIDEMLKQQEAKRLGIQVDSQQVDNILGNMAKRSRMSPSQFKKALGQIGINIRTLRQRVEADVAWRDVIRGRFGRTIRIREADIDRELQSLGGGEEKTRYEYELRQVLFIVPDGAPKRFFAIREDEANRKRGNFNTCEDLTQSFSGTRDLVVQKKRKVSTDQMTSATLKLLDGVEAGQITRARVTPQGAELLAICNKTAITDTKAAEDVVARDLQNKELEIRARRHLRDLKQDAVIQRR